MSGLLAGLQHDRRARARSRDATARHVEITTTTTTTTTRQFDSTFRATAVVVVVAADRSDAGSCRLAGERPAQIVDAAAAAALTANQNTRPEIARRWVGSVYFGDNAFFTSPIEWNSDRSE